MGGTGVDLGDMKGLAEGLWGKDACRGLIGWKLKCLLRAVTGAGLWPRPLTDDVVAAAAGATVVTICCCCCDCCTVC